MAKYHIKQVPRVIILLIYIFILFLINKIIFNSWLPPLGVKGFWFYVSLLSLLLGTHLITPYFNKPVDAIAYSVPAFIALFLINNWSSWTGVEKTLFLIAIMYAFGVAISAFISILLKDRDNILCKNISEFFRLISDQFGTPEIIYSLMLWMSLYIFHRTEPKEILLIGLAWSLTVALRPLEKCYLFYKKVKDIWLSNVPSYIIGEIAAYQTPGIVLIRKKKQEHIPFATPLLINDPHSSIRVGMSLDYVGRDDGVLLRTIEIDESFKLDDPCLNFQSMPDNCVAKLDQETFNTECEKISKALEKSKDFVGIVAENTSVNCLYFEVVKERDIEEGRLVETTVGKDKVLYQIIDGLTKEEIVSQKNKFGYARAQAQKIGIWKEGEKKFVHAKWIPQLNTPVYLKPEEEFIPRENVVGHFPKTNYTVGIKNVHELVTHNTAILGILGVGKTFLSLELVERMITEGIKVICLDLTNQYATHLGHYYDEGKEVELLAKLNKRGRAGKTNVQKNVEEGGSITKFSKAISTVLRRFVKSEKENLKIFNPAQLEVWKQDSKPFKEKASMASLTPTEIAQIITEKTLELVQEQGVAKEEKARICLIYEEAHSLVPEWNSVASEGDKAATNGTARAILQGRKYGMGCLLITQRTANVTKTILNQCNTIFAMRSFDKTGKDFLSDYMGEEYAQRLSLLKERQAVFFGKASSCENPVLIRLNDRDDFLKAFREEHPPPDLEKRTEDANNNDEKSNTET